MPYDAQGRWIEENEWQQMMREQAAQRVGAFSRYNDAPPSLYPNQAAPYGSFPYADPTPSIWDTSPERVRQDVEPQYRQPWMFNQEPIADTSAISDIPFVSGIVRRGPGGRKGKRVAMTPEQVAERDANRQRVADQQLKREIQRIDKIDKAASPVQSKSSASAVKRGDTSLQQADDVRRKAQAAIEKQTRLGGAKLPGVLALADVVGDLTRPEGEKQTGIGYLGEQLMDTLEQGRQRAAEVAEIEPYTGMGDAPDLMSTGHPGMLGATGYDLSDPTGGLAATDPNLQGTTPRSMAQVGGIPSGRTFGVPATEDYGYVETPYSFTGTFNGQPRTDVYSGSDPGLETVTPLFDVLTMGTGIKGAYNLGKVLSNIDRIPSAHSVPGMRFTYRDWDNLRNAPFGNKPAWRGTTKVNPVTPASVLTKPASQVAVGLTPEVDDVVAAAIASAAAAPKGALERKSDDAARAAAAQAEKDRQAQIAAANAAANALAAANARAKTAAANRAKVAAAKAASRKAAAARLAARKSAAKSAAAARAAAARAVAASAAQANIARAKAKAVLAAAASSDRGGPSSREIAAAIEVMSQVDSFGSGGMGMGFMGSNIGQEDGGGYTGGDFSSGQGWE